MSDANKNDTNTKSEIDCGPGGRLVPVLGWFTAGTIVVGGVIGSGVFFKPSVVAKETGGNFGLIISLWVICGLINLCGALTLAELSAMMPRAGGTYLFLRESYGRMCAFLWGWAEFWVIRSGAIAGLAVAMTMSMRPLLESAGGGMTGVLDNWYVWEKVIAIATIVLLATLNVIGTHWGGSISNLTTTIKVGFLLFLAAMPFIFTGHQRVDLGTLWPETIDQTIWGGIAASLAAIMWAYDGWGNVTVVAEEIHHPQRNVPIAMAGGVTLLIALYVGANFAYHLTLPVDQIIESKQLPVDVVSKLFSSFGSGAADAGAKFMSVVLMISVFGALNQNILTGPRVLFAVARDHPKLAKMRHIDPRTKTPAVAIIAQSVWSIVLVITLGGVSSNPNVRLFDVLTNYCIFGGSIFYLLAVVGVFVLRRKEPDAPRPYRTWGYPIVPLVFIVFYLFLLAGMLWKMPGESLLGLTLIATGAVFYWLVVNRKRAG